MIRVVRRRSDHGAVRAPYRAAGHNDLDPRVAIEQHRHVEIVGDDQQILVRRQRARDLFRRGADIDEQRAAVGNLCRRRRADGFLFLRRDEPSRLIGQVFHARGDDRAAMTRVIERRSHRSLMSLRMVCADTSKRRARSSTVTRPEARAMFRMSDWRLESSVIQHLNHGTGSWC